ncbi:MAG: 3-oxoacyl-ACP reductase [Polyangiaceae bacterium UTPRO1]|jgi:3-oxoacyl-[acyl-carrier protein] reductase|nr:SDR family NAD(P)-dependent oxidoreductase [Myxococcales bacterium]OQY66116.1 MAG: 3-oxoacyl-ACP reductase [Polyangiaceae bacterium UTPRO1]
MSRLTKLSRSIAGRAALVTGAASGIGRATAQLFADEGAHVAVTDRSAAAVADVVREIIAAGGSAHGWTMDVSDGARVGAVVDEVATRFGRLDILVNNAGLALVGAIDAPDYEQIWTASIDVLLTAHTRTVRAALPHLRRSNAARIVNVSSTEGLGATRFASAYTAAKHGVIGLTRALAVELGREGITVNAVCPGPIRTGITAAIPEEAKREFARRRTVLGRYGEPEEVAHATLALVLPAAAYITGAHLVVDGGVTARNA